MSLLMRDVVTAHRDRLRREPVPTRIRGAVAGALVVDTTHAQLVWEPRRLLCEYAVPEADLAAELVTADTGTAGGSVAPPAEGLVMPDVPFAAHTTPGTPLDLHVGDRVLAEAAFRPDEPDLAGWVLVDFAALDEWWHEEERNVGHPRDPYHRVESLASARTVRVELDGVLLAESAHQVVIHESHMPPRWYLPAQDVRVELLPSDTRTVCTYKGTASYASVRVGDRLVEDVAWSYPDALLEAAPAQGHWCFDDSLVQVTVTP